MRRKRSNLLISLIITTLCTAPWALPGCALLDIQGDGSGWGDWQDWPGSEDPRAAFDSRDTREPRRSPASGWGERARGEMAESYGFAPRRDVSVGMRMNDVTSIWGEPREIYTAGDPRYGNEKWIYTEGPGGRYGLSPTRIIYFENGRVVGWDTTR